MDTIIRNGEKETRVSQDAPSAFGRPSMALVWYLPSVVFFAVLFGRAILGYVRVKRDRELK
jgi:hypothetical protein